MARGLILQAREPIGFGGKTLKIIKSMYCNDSLRFLVNGKFTDQLWLTQGVKQGKNKLWLRGPSSSEAKASSYS